MKTIIVFLNGQTINQITYKSKTEAKLNYRFFKKRGILDPESGEVLQGAYFELI